MSETSGTPQPPPDSGHSPGGPVSFLAAAAALSDIDEAVRGARDPAERAGAEPLADLRQALAALLLLREVRTELADWEAGLVETARAAGATWADLAPPMGVASRQAAENRYLRLRRARTGEAASSTASTGAERVKAERDRRAADRTVSAWARAHTADLRVLAAQITALTGLAPDAQPAVDALHTALGSEDAAGLIGPLTYIRPHLAGDHAGLTARLDALTTQADRLRQDSNRRRA